MYSLSYARGYDLIFPQFFDEHSHELLLSFVPALNGFQLHFPKSKLVSSSILSFFTTHCDLCHAHVLSRTQLERSKLSRLFTSAACILSLDSSISRRLRAKSRSSFTELIDSIARISELSNKSRGELPTLLGELDVRRRLFRTSVSTSFSSLCKR